MKEILISVVLAVLISLGGMFLYTEMQSKPTQDYIVVNQFMEEFKMAQELNVDFEQVVNQRKTILDSLGINLDKMLSTYKEGDKDAELVILRQKELLYQKSQQFEEQSLELRNRYNEQIAKRMNEYLKQFGKEQGSTFIFGANGNGSILYADDARDITTKFIEYANKKYNGIK